MYEEEHETTLPDDILEGRGYYKTPEECLASRKAFLLSNVRSYRLMANNAMRELDNLEKNPPKPVRME